MASLAVAAAGLTGPESGAVRPSRRIVILLMAAAPSAAGCASSAGNAPPGECGNDWWRCVYSPKRLIIQDPCVTVRGTVLAVRYVLDADAIVFLRLDPAYAHFSNPANDKSLGKDVVELEIVCRHALFRLFVFRCWTCHSTIPVPRVGDHIEADGVYVLDTHHEHLELHPVTRITTLSDTVR
jgi:hypothetical protein